MKFGFGQPVTRVEDQKLIYGTGQYTDDILPGQPIWTSARRAKQTVLFWPLPKQI